MNTQAPQIHSISKKTLEKLFECADIEDPDGEIENSRKSIFEIRIPNFCYIQVIVFDLSYLPVATVGTYQVRYHEKMWKIEKIAKVKNYNLNITEVRDSNFKNAFTEIFNFTVGILDDEVIPRKAQKVGTINNCKRLGND